MMKKHARRLALLLLSATVLFSCKKGETPNIFPLTVYSTGVTQKNNLRMFVGGVEITDNLKIKKYMSDLPVKTRSSSILTNFPSSYTFKSPDSLQISNSTNISYSFDTVTGKQVITFSNVSPVDPLKGAFDVNKFYLYPTTSVPVTAGFSTTNFLVAYGNYMNFKMPVLNYKYRKPSSSFTATGLINNEFNAAALSTMASTDTIAVQEFFVYYAAKSSY